jgi:hypothetical protein
MGFPIVHGSAWKASLTNQSEPADIQSSSGVDAIQISGGRCTFIVLNGVGCYGLLPTARTPRYPMRMKIIALDSAIPLVVA